MQSGLYILHARGGQLNKVQVHKVRLARDPKGHAQGMRISRTADGKLYISTSSLLHISIDQGRTWRSRPMSNSPGGGLWVARPDGSLVTITLNQGVDVSGPATIWISEDEGKTHRKLTEISLDLTGTPHENATERYAHSSLNILSDGTLMFGIDARNATYEERAGKTVCLSGSVTNYFWFSRDGGETWQGPSKPVHWTSEGGATLLPSGKILASFRHQRPMLPGDPANVYEISKSNQSYVWKHVFLSESEDGGMTWSSLRRLTTHFGQCYGWPAALSDGTVVVVHDTRYGPGSQSGRAVVSFNEGQTWEDEVYYLYYGPGVPSGRALISRDAGRTWEDETYYLFYDKVRTGYSQSIQLKDGVVLTIGATVSSPPEAYYDFHAGIGHADLWAIRWKPV